MKQPKPASKKYIDLILEIEKGEIKIPQFQRDFVWSLDKTAQLLDSILKGYPIGTFILWETTVKLNDIKNIGNFVLPSVADGDKVQYVLDGQQRITSLYAAFKGEKIQKDGEKKINDYSKIYVDLGVDIENDDEQIIVSEKPEGESVTLNEILNFSDNVLNIKENFSDDQFKLINSYFQSFSTYDFSTVVLRKEDIDSAIEVFTRINTGGQTLTLFEIMSAKTYDEGQKFDMERSFQELIEDLRDVGYETISSSVILSLISLILKKDCRRRVILQLDKQEIIRVWNKVISALKDSIEYFRRVYHIPASSILPYDSLLIPFAYFIYKKGDPVGNQIDLLEEFFWRVSLSHRYSSSTESKFVQDIKRIEDIWAGKRPKYEDFNINFTTDDLINTGFSTGNSYCKAILCLLADYKPTDFDNSKKEVTLNNSWLKIANSKNYHHFFPKAFLKKERIGNADSIVNITLVSDSLNKRQIKDKPPSKYIRGFLEQNSKLRESIKSHLIEDIEGFGIMEDDYGKFLKKRAEVIHRELKKRMNPDID